MIYNFVCKNFKILSILGWIVSFIPNRATICSNSVLKVKIRWPRFGMET
jgi:hypothetical protein